MSKPHGLLPLLVLLLVSTASVTAQTHKEFGAWSYVGLDDYESAYTESTDPHRVFSLEVECNRGNEPGLNVALSFLLPSLDVDAGFDRERFDPDGKVETRLDGEKLEGDGWSFSSHSGVFEHQQPEVFLADLKEANRMSIEVWDTAGEHVGTYSFDLRGVASFLDFLSCYDGAQEDEPIGEAPTSSPSVSSENLKPGNTYRITESAPLMPAFEPRDHLAATAAAVEMPAGTHITVKEVRMKEGTPWYQVEAIRPTGGSLGTGWLNSVALIGQDVRKEGG